MLCNAPLSTRLVAHGERTGGRGGKELAPADEASKRCIAKGREGRADSTHQKSSMNELTDGDDLMVIIIIMSSGLRKFRAVRALLNDCLTPCTLSSKPHVSRAMLRFTLPLVLVLPASRTCG